MRIIEQIIENIREAFRRQFAVEVRDCPVPHQTEPPGVDYDYTMDEGFVESLLREEAIPDFSDDPNPPKKGTKQAKLLKLLQNNSGIAPWFITHKLKVSKSAAYSMIHDLRRRGYRIEMANGYYILMG